MATGDHDWTAGEEVTAANVDDYLMLQAVQQFATAAARDTALSARKRENMVTAQADTNCLTVYSGAAWNTIGPVHGALTTWTPTITQSASVTFTNTYSRYIRVGRLVTGWFNLAVTSAGTISNAVIIGLPLTAASSGVSVGVGEITDVSAGQKYAGRLYLGSTTTLDLRSGGTTGAPLDNRLGISNFVAALASGDFIEGTFSYEISADG